MIYYDLVYKNRTINKTVYNKNGHSLYLSMAKHREGDKSNFFYRCQIFV